MLEVIVAELVNITIPKTTIGIGTIKNIGQEAQKLGASKILVITDKGIVQASILGALKDSLQKTGIPFEIFDGCKPEPSIDITLDLANLIKKDNYDLLIGVGGGSNMDATKVASTFARSNTSFIEFMKNPRGTKVDGKAVAKILVPTTAGTGAEWSSAAVIYDKEGIGHPFALENNLADKVIIDPEMTFNLPAKITADTGFDALTHAIEAYTCSNANFFSDILASSAIRMISENLRLAFAKGSKNTEARFNMSAAAAMAMSAGISSGLGMCHFVGEYVQAKAHISHGASLALMLPAVMEFNLIGNLRKFAKIAEFMGEDVSSLSVLEAGDKSIKLVKKLVNDLGLPQTLKEVGIAESDIDLMAKHCYQDNSMVIKMWNPRDASEADIAKIFRMSL
jgi:alcohol dehydrogenase